jgi:hypothetical protein
MSGPENYSCNFIEIAPYEPEFTPPLKAGDGPNAFKTIEVSTASSLSHPVYKPPLIINIKILSHEYHLFLCVCIFSRFMD